jgi:hypothetical protein
VLGGEGLKEEKRNEESKAKPDRLWKHKPDRFWKYKPDRFWKPVRFMRRGRILFHKHYLFPMVLMDKYKQILVLLQPVQYCFRKLLKTETETGFDELSGF